MQQFKDLYKASENAQSILKSKKKKEVKPGEAVTDDILPPSYPVGYASALTMDAVGR